jgi:hypothetical protein
VHEFGVVWSALDEVTNARARVDRATSMIEQLDREPAHRPVVTANRADGEQSFLPTLRFHREKLPGRSSGYRHLDEPPHFRSVRVYKGVG